MLEKADDDMVSTPIYHGSLQADLIFRKHPDHRWTGGMRHEAQRFKHGSFCRIRKELLTTLKAGPRRSLIASPEKG
jgi:hypothetical protein